VALGGLGLALRRSVGASWLMGKSIVLCFYWSETSDIYRIADSANLLCPMTTIAKAVLGERLLTLGDRRIALR
jgi:hypothetical protein